MDRITKKIDKKYFDNRNKKNNSVASEDEIAVFGYSIVCGYGLYGSYCFEENNEYYVTFDCGDNCD